MDDFRSLNLHFWVKFCVFSYIYFSGKKAEGFYRILSGISEVNLKPLLFSTWPAFG